MNPLTLYWSPICAHSLGLKAVLEHFHVPFEAVQAESESQLPQSTIYGETPLLVHGARTVEDPRAILRYMDEYLLDKKIGGLTIAAQARFFDALDLLESKVLTVMSIAHRGESLFARPGGLQEFDDALSGAELLVGSWEEFAGASRLLHLLLFSNVRALQGREPWWGRVSAREKLTAWYRTMEGC
jgi:hypothetical protein